MLGAQVAVSGGLNFFHEPLHGNAGPGFWGPKFTSENLGPQKGPHIWGHVLAWYDTTRHNKKPAKPYAVRVCDV
jgi:hypothetical protein